MNRRDSYILYYSDMRKILYKQADSSCSRIYHHGTFCLTHPTAHKLQNWVRFIGHIFCHIMRHAAPVDTLSCALPLCQVMMSPEHILFKGLCSWWESTEFGGHCWLSHSLCPQTLATLSHRRVACTFAIARNHKCSGLGKYFRYIYSVVSPSLEPFFVTTIAVALPAP